MRSHRVTLRRYYYHSPKLLEQQTPYHFQTPHRRHRRRRHSSSSFSPRKKCPSMEPPLPSLPVQSLPPTLLLLLLEMALDYYCASPATHQREYWPPYESASRPRTPLRPANSAKRPSLSFRSCH